MSVRVSIIIPVHNDAARLRTLLASLQAPATVSREVIVIDNRSTDDVAGVVAAFDGVTLLHEPAVQSAYAARNTGVRAARGDILVFTDADCIAEPGWLDALAAAFGDGVGAVAGPIRGTVPRNAVERLSEQRALLSQERYMQARPRPVAATANLAVRATAFRALGGFTPHLQSMGDFELCHRLQEELGLRLLMAPGAVVRHQHRASWRGLFWQSFRDGVGWVYIRRQIVGFSLPPPPPGRIGWSELLFMAVHYGGLILGYGAARIRPRRC